MSSRIMWAVVVVSGAAMAGDLKRPDTNAAAAPPVVTPTAATAPRTEGPSVVSGPTWSSGEPRDLRVRLGVLGGLNMQKTDVELAANVDLFTLAPKLKVFAELAFGLRPLEVSFIPAAGIRYQLAIASSPKLHPWFSGQAGLAVTVMRGGLALAVPLSLGLGALYDLSPKLAIGLDLGVSVGPLLAPFSDLYASAHGGVCGSWSL